jgi:competence protein ComEC
MQSDAFSYSESPLIAMLGETVTLEGVVVAELDIRERSARMIVAIGDDRILVQVDRYSPVTYGDRVSVTGQLTLPKNFTGDDGRVFDYQGYLRARNIGYVMSFPESVTVIGSREGNKFIHLLYDVKQAFVSAINETISDPSAGLGVGLLLGVEQALGAELEQAFRTTGVIHIVVLSGFNVMIVVAAVMFLLSSVLPLRPRVVVGIMAIITFALLVGLSATVVRATIMAGLILMAQFIGRQYHMLRALCLAGALMVLIEPHILAFDIGFQLSFMATLGLVLVAPQFETIMGYVPTTFGVREFLIATLATQIAVLPLLMYHIGEVSLIAVLVNILILPLVPVAMGFTFVTGVVALLAPLVVLPFALLTHAVLLTMIRIVEWCATIPFASVTVPPIPWYGVGILYTLIATSVYAWATLRARSGSFLIVPVEQSRSASSHINRAVPKEHSIDLSTWTIVEEEIFRRELRMRIDTDLPKD